MAERILIRGVNWLGDAVMTIPALRSIRQAYPKAHIALLVKPTVAKLFEAAPYIDEIILYDRQHSGMRGKLRLGRELRTHNFTHAILLQNAFDAALIAWLARIPNRIGYSRDGRGMLLTQAIPFNGEDRKLHHIDYYLDMLKSAGIAAVKSEPWLELTLSERKAAFELIAPMRRPIVGLNPGAAFGSAKHWPVDRFKRVAESVINELGGSVIVFGGPAELDIAARIGGTAVVPKGRLLPLAGMTTVRELMALIAACDVLVSNDSGPMHIGYAVRTPLVGIFGSTEPDLTGPLARKGNIVLRGKSACTPCFERTCKLPRIECMESISVDAVMGAVKALLPTRKAVFFDRDGTLCIDAHFLNSWDNFSEFQDIGELNRLKAAGYMLVGVSNQSGIARGLVDETFTCGVNQHYMDNRDFDDFYYCPHGPDEGCDCRKPSPGMLLRARAEHGIDLRSSWVIGDKDVDILLAHGVGARSILVQTGKQEQSEHADFIATGLTEAVKRILSEV